MHSASWRFGARGAPRDPSAGRRRRHDGRVERLRRDSRCGSLLPENERESGKSGTRGTRDCESAAPARRSAAGPWDSLSECLRDRGGAGELHPSRCSEAVRVRTDLMKLGLQALRGELLKKRFGVGRKPRRTRARSRHREAEEPSRQVPAAVAREVYERDGGRCTFCSEDGRRCGTRELLQLDHIIPFANGGESTLLNLRLRCRAHNLLAARQHFGSEYMRTAVARARDKRREQPDGADQSTGQ